MMDYLLVFAVGVVLGGGVMYFAIRRLSMAEPAACAPDLTIPAELPSAEPAKDVPSPAEAPAFVVAGSPRLVPWRVRRKELAAKARTKRERLEAWNGTE